MLFWPDEKSFDDLAFFNVLIEHLLGIGQGFHPIPDPFGIDHDGRPFGAMIQASRGVSPYFRFKASAFDLAFEELPDLFGTLRSTATPGV